MPFNIQQINTIEEHAWAVVHAKTNLTDKDDPLLNQIIDRVYQAYGENRIMTYAQQLTPPTPDPLVVQAFNLEAIQRAIRLGLPNPEIEQNKPPHLTTYRAETAELIAQGALAATYNISFPAAPQLGKPNPNQPILGFDGWGFLPLTETRWALVLVQVKATEDKRRPPTIAKTLLKECQQIKKQWQAIARTLSVLVIYLHGSTWEAILLQMLTTLGEGMLPQLIVAPVIVRGEQLAHQDDLKPLKKESHTFNPAVARGLTVSIGANLTEFGRTVMMGARN